ncbi:MAG: hypothetical protein KBS43_06285 [Oscillospiraceae bacterium]|nr:hypothetical protein [Candidatus Limimonas coprohippi]MCQ2488818.1 ATP-binding protein [Clostridia bacterium]
MQLSSDLFKAYIEDATVLLNEMDLILKKRNSMGRLDSESVDALFRIFHTIKASAVVLDDAKTADVAYKLENIMSYLRKHGVNSLPSKKVLSILFDSEYFLRAQLGSVAASKVPSKEAKIFGELREFAEEIDFADDSPIELMVSFDAFRPILENVTKEMCEELDKEVALTFDGDNLYIDRTLVTRLAGPLTQIVRNAVDHGIESPDEREKLGKPRCGTISINYGLEDNILFITISNDGEKLHLKKILRKADSLNILKKPRDQYSPNEIAALIMERGFTTKEHVGKWSGRGVGMDIVKSTAQDLGGNLLISSGETQGFSITLTFPVDEQSQRASIKERIKK